MWNSPMPTTTKNLFAARVCDDLAGLAAIIAVLDQLIATKTPAHLIALCSRGEEVGVRRRPRRLRKPLDPQTFPRHRPRNLQSFPRRPPRRRPHHPRRRPHRHLLPGLTHCIAQTAGHIADDDSSFSIDTNSWMAAPATPPPSPPTTTTPPASASPSATTTMSMFENPRPNASKTRPHLQGKAHRPRRPPIASETIHLADFHPLVRLLIETAKRIPTYRPGWTSSANASPKCTTKNKKPCSTPPDTPNRLHYPFILSPCPPVRRNHAATLQAPDRTLHPRGNRPNGRRADSVRNLTVPHACPARSRRRSPTPPPKSASRILPSTSAIRHRRVPGHPQGCRRPRQNHRPRPGHDRRGRRRRSRLPGPHRLALTGRYPRLGRPDGQGQSLCRKGAHQSRSR